MSNFVIQTKDKIIINGEVIVNTPKNLFGIQCVFQYCNDIYINGYKYNTKNKEFKFSIIGFLNLFF